MKEALLGLANTHKIDCVVTGAIASEYQNSRIERICSELGLRSIAPLWRREPGRPAERASSDGLPVHNDSMHGYGPRLELART